MAALSRHGRRVVAALVPVIVPDFPTLEPAARDAVRSDVADYVSGQLAGLPAHLAVPGRLALRTFDALAWLRFGRPYTRLDRQRAGRYLQLWDAVPLAPPRDFVKLVRSCTLLAYFDHPQVTARLHGHALPGTAR